MKNALLIVVTCLFSCVVLAGSPVKAKPSIKKGLGLSRKRVDNWDKVLQDLEVHWYYNWYWKPGDKETPDIEFVPMIWGGSKSLEDKIAFLASSKRDPSWTHLLGFNEPDHRNQANMTVEHAIELWPRLMTVDMRLGSPAPVHARKEWMQNFMKEAEAKEHRVDFVNVHWYRNPDPIGFLEYLQEVYELYKKPLWITEFAVADWKAKGGKPNQWSVPVIKYFMKEVLPELEKLPYVERYAWFSGRPTSGPLGTSALFDEKGNLTELGEIYRSF